MPLGQSQGVPGVHGSEGYKHHVFWWCWFTGQTHGLCSLAVLVGLCIHVKFCLRFNVYNSSVCIRVETSLFWHDRPLCDGKRWKSKTPQWHPYNIEMRRNMQGKVKLSLHIVISYYIKKKQQFSRNFIVAWEYSYKGQKPVRLFQVTSYKVCPVVLNS